MCFSRTRLLPRANRCVNCNRPSSSSAASRWRRIRCRRRSALFPRWPSRRQESWYAVMGNVIVTGGSRGIGLGIVRRLAKAGNRVIALARKESPELRAAIDEAASRGTGSIGFAAYDLAETDGMAALVKQLRKDLGPIYALVNNAGMSIDGTLALASATQIEQVVRLNVVSPILLSKYVLRSMMADGPVVSGRIVNLASIVAFTGYSGLSVYAATKASLIGFTRSLAREVGPTGVTVNAV